MTSKPKRALYTVLISITVLALSQISLTQAAPDGGQVRSSLRFALPDQHGSPMKESQKHFDCLDKIYAATNLSNLEKGKHDIEFRWTDPSGDPRESTQYAFYITDEPKAKLWAWLELSRAKGAAMIQWINPAAGLEEFIGVWHVELFVDGKSLQKGEFEVSC